MYNLGLPPSNKVIPSSSNLFKLEAEIKPPVN